jgi:amidase
MGIRPPTNDDLRQIAGQYGFGLSSRDIESFRVLITGALASYDAVERLYRARLPEPPSRTYQWPSTGRTSWGRGM